MDLVIETDFTRKKSIAGTTNVSHDVFEEVYGDTFSFKPHPPQTNKQTSQKHWPRRYSTSILHCKNPTNSRRRHSKSTLTGKDLQLIDLQNFPRCVSCGNLVNTKYTSDRRKSMNDLLPYSSGNIDEIERKCGRRQHVKSVTNNQATMQVQCDRSTRCLSDKAKTPESVTIPKPSCKGKPISVSFPQSAQVARGIREEYQEIKGGSDRPPKLHSSDIFLQLKFEKAVSGTACDFFVPRAFATEQNSAFDASSSFSDKKQPPRYVEVVVATYLRPQPPSLDSLIRRPSTLTRREKAHQRRRSLPLWSKTRMGESCT